MNRIAARIDRPKINSCVLSAALRAVLIAVLAVLSVGCSPLMADSLYVNFSGNITEIREYRNNSNTVTRRELWLAVKTPSGVIKTFQFRCTPSMSECEDLDLLDTCVTTGTGGGTASGTYSGTRCSSGFGVCRELIGHADRDYATDGSILFHLDQSIEAAGCAPK